MDKSSQINLQNEPNLIELEGLSSKKYDKSIEENNEIEEEEREIKDDMLEIQKTENKYLKKESSKKEKETKVNINLSVEDIYKIISRGGKLNSYKITCTIIYSTFTIVFLNTFFIMIIAFLRPTLKTNKFLCYDAVTNSYSKCFILNKCKCSDNFCVQFCYENEFKKCNEYFTSIIEEIEEKKSFFDYTIIDRSFIKYEINKKERKSLFQKIGKYYCFSLYIELLFILLFVIGSYIGFLISGILCDILGKKKVISILGIGLSIINGFITILSIKWNLKDHIKLLISLWSINFFFLGIFLLPFDSAIYIYTLELIPKTDFLKSINGLFYEKYFISLFIFYIFERFFKYYFYFFIFFEVYLIIFILSFIFSYIETPRFFSERNDLMNKKLSIEHFSNGFVTFDLDLNENPKQFIKSLNILENNKNNDNRIENQPKKIINMKTIINTYNKNMRIIKKNYMIHVSFFSLSFSLYTILFTTIFDFMDPNLNLSSTKKIGFLSYLLILFPLLQFPSYFCYELIDLDKFIMFFLFILSFIPFNYDLDKLKLEYDRMQIFYGKAVQYMFDSNPYILASSFLIITFVISIFNIMILLQASTLYRTYFYFKLQRINSFTIFLAFFSVYLTKSPLILISILSFITALSFAIMRIKWKFDPFEEEIDIEKN